MKKQLRIVKKLWLPILLACSGTAAADYEGDRLANDNTTYTGNITVTDTTAVSFGQHSGAVYRTLPGITRLIGNIVLNGTINNTSEEANYNYGDGVFVNHSAQVFLSTDAVGQTIDITTLKGYGICVLHNPNAVEVAGQVFVIANAGAQLQDVVINSQNSGVFTDGEGALVNITGNTIINAGSYAEYNSHTGVYSHAGGKISMSGRLDVTAGSYGILSAAEGSVVDLRNTTYTKIRSQNTGIAAFNGVIYLGSHLDVEEHSTYQAGAMEASGTTGGISGSGNYTIKGRVRSISNASINLDMIEQSVFTGFTNIIDSGKIDIALSDDSIWTVTEDSIATNLTLNEGGTVHFTVDGNNFSPGLNNSATTISLDGYMAVEDRTHISLNMGGYTGVPLLDGDEIKLVFARTYANPDSKITFSVSGYQLDEGLEWDWSTFAADGTIRVRTRIPEPATVSLTLLGLSSLLMRRRRTERF